MRRSVPLRVLVLVTAAAAFGALFAAQAPTAAAQGFGPPMTLFGSITDSGGTVEANLAVETYVGDVLCGRGKTEFVGEGNARVTVYAADVVAREQTAGCGTTGADVRVKVGDRFATQTIKWEQGPQRLDITFGNATPAAIPTFTPAPTRTPTPAPTRGAGTPVPGASSTAAPAGSAASGTPAATAAPGDPTHTPALGRTAVSTQGGASLNDDSGGGGGFPIWAGVVIVLGVLAAAGGGLGIFASRRRQHDGEDGPGLG